MSARGREFIETSLILISSLFGMSAFDGVRQEAPRWGAELVHDWVAPLAVVVVNDRQDTIPIVNIRAAGSVCETTCIEPNGWAACHLDSDADSAVSIQLPTKAFPEVSDEPYRELPVVVSWRTHGVLEVHVLDSDVEVNNALTDDLLAGHDSIVLHGASSKSPGGPRAIFDSDLHFVGCSHDTSRSRESLASQDRIDRMPSAATSTKEF
jgi:hypothetical protein